MLNTSTVTVHLMGGMANQMFQYAAGLALARRHAAELVLDTSWYRQDVPGRPFQLGHFGVGERVVSEPLARPRLRKWLSRHPALKATARVVGGGDLKVGWYRETSHHFDSAFFRLAPPCEIRGYFQSPLYFQGVEEDLRARFTNIPALSPEGARWAGVIRERPCSVAVHIRGGDYLTQGAGAALAPLPASYYGRTLRILGALLGRPLDVFVFTDDVDHARKVLPEGVRAEHVATPADRPWEDLYLMSLCHHNIIANSSFSWWGAWLGTFSDKTVLAPRQWFTAATMREKNICDLYPDTWILA